MNLLLENVRLRLKRFEELERLLGDPNVIADPAQLRTLAKERAAMMPLVEKCRLLLDVRSQISQAREILDSKDGQEEMRALAKAEVEALGEQEQQLQRQLEDLLVEQDPEDQKSVIMEIRAGTGGAEASLFAVDLYRMYTRYAAKLGWAVEPLSMSATEVGGFKETIFGVEGDRVFRQLKFERGVHRVQRVPATEASGRIHTSAATVAVLPEAEEFDIKIDEKDLRIDVFRASGPGGQSVNTTDSAVRITHIPTNTVVSQQDEKSQHKNKAKAMKILRARLYDAERQRRDDARAADRKGQVGSGDRSERIRTYNFPQSRVTDHRINLTLYSLDQVMEGRGLDEIIDALIADDEASRLAELAS